jgi:hypothetical protein
MICLDRAEQAPPFHLTPEQIAICHAQAALGWLDATLEQMHRQWACDRRPILGEANSLNTIGDRAFDAAWTANREANMAQAYAEWQRVAGVAWRAAA